MRKGSAIILATAALLLAACGGDDEPTQAERPDEVPTAEVLGEQVTQPTPTAIVATSAPSALVHTVAAGDTMGIIAQRYGVTVDAIAEANDIENVDVLSIGQELKIPDAPQPAPGTDGAETPADG